MSMKNTFIREQLKTPHILTYVRDSLGYPKGVIIAFSKDNIGWSLVNPDDSFWKIEKPHNVPAISHMLRKGMDWNAIVNTPVWKKLVNLGFMVKHPKFDKELGVIKAVHRAVSSKTKVSKTPDNLVIISGDIIRDTDLWEALEVVNHRLEKAKSLNA